MAKRSNLPRELCHCERSEAISSARGLSLPQPLLDALINLLEKRAQS
jgi:hypothetical protein